MSKEAWGDGDEPATHWDQTAQFDEFHTIRNKWLAWLVAYKDVSPNDEFDRAAAAITDALDVLSLEMEGEL